jgi:hypothetical protein
VCTPDQTPAAPNGFGSGFIDGLRARQQQQQQQSGTGPRQPSLDLREPTDTELHASYCIAILQDISDTWQRSVAGNDAYAEQLRGQLASNPPPPEDLAVLIRKQLATLEEAKKNDAFYQQAQTALKRLQLYMMPRATKIQPDGPLAAMQSAHSDYAALTSGKVTPHGPDPRVQACFDQSWLPY